MVDKKITPQQRQAANQFVHFGMDGFLNEKYDKFSANDFFGMFRFVTPETASKVICYCNRHRLVPEFKYWRRLKSWSWDAVTDSSGTRLTRKVKL